MTEEKEEIICPMCGDETRLVIESEDVPKCPHCGYNYAHDEKGMLKELLEFIEDRNPMAIETQRKVTELRNKYGVERTIGDVTMTACEKCWSDAQSLSVMDGRPVYEHYMELLERRKDNPCKEE